MRHSMHARRGQGALEYTILVGGAILFVIIVIALLRTGVFQKAEVQTGNRTAGFFEYLNQTKQALTSPTPTPSPAITPTPSPAGYCSDGTASGACNTSNRPYYCDAGNLVPKCSLCGCPIGFTCLANEKCGASALLGTSTYWSLGNFTNTTYNNEYVFLAQASPAYRPSGTWEFAWDTEMVAGFGTINWTTANNVAFNKTCSASSETPGSECGKAVDEDNSTMWNAGAGAPAWWRVDLGDNLSISSTMIACDGAGGNSGNVTLLDYFNATLNTSNYTCTNAANTTVFTYSPAVAGVRYALVNVTGGGDLAHVNELRLATNESFASAGMQTASSVTGPVNIAPTGTAYANSEWPGYPAGYGTDNDLSTRWSIAEFSGTVGWLEVNWTTARNVSEAEMICGCNSVGDTAGCPMDFQIQYYSGGWVNASIVSGNSAGTRRLSFTPVPAARWRISVDSTIDSSCALTLREFRLFEGSYSWSALSTPYASSTGSAITSPAGRFLKILATLSTTRSSVTPLLDSIGVNVTYPA